MQFIQGQLREQTYFTTLEDQVAVDNPVRLIDAFIDKLDLQQLGFQKGAERSEGRPSYGPQVLLNYTCMDIKQFAAAVVERSAVAHRVTVVAPGAASQLSYDC
jgi:hypothetical protein